MNLGPHVLYERPLSSGIMDALMVAAIETAEEDYGMSGIEFLHDALDDRAVRKEFFYFLFEIEPDAVQCDLLFDLIEDMITYAGKDDDDKHND